MTNSQPATSPRDFVVFRYLDDLNLAFRNALLDQGTAWLGFWGKLLQGNYNPKNLLSDTARLWNDSVQSTLSLLGFPFAFARASSGQIPTATFLIDDASQAASEQSVCPPVKLEDNFIIQTTPLRPIGASGITHEIPAAHVQARASETRDQLVIAVNNLGGLSLAPGVYVGLVYVLGPGQPVRPLALIHLFVTKAGEHTTLPQK